MVLMMACVLLLGLAAASAEEGKIPITTSSEKALELYLQGRELQDNLRLQESLRYLREAVSVDPFFALAYLGLSRAEPTVSGFFDTYNIARALVDSVSKGEQLMIRGFEAGVNSDPVKQRGFYSKLTARFPKDERAHTLLGNHYFGQQEYQLAIRSYDHAIAVDPQFPPPYNQLGYAHRFLGDYANSETAFKKYIELIPDDPNPYDSYAELLLKMGNFDQSIEYYQRALAVSSHFVASHVGIATNLNFIGKHAQARTRLRELYDMARNDGERRAAIFGIAVSYADDGELDKALQEIDKQYILAENNDDTPSMAGDLVLMGNILLEMGKPDEALMKYDKSMKLMKGSELAKEVIDNAIRGHVYNSGCVAVAKGDLETAKEKAVEYEEQVKALQIPLQIRRSHGLHGLIALAEENYDIALDEFRQANQQNPYNLYRVALAFHGKGNNEKAQEWCRMAADFNALNNLNYAFMRKKARDMLGSMQ